MGAGPVPAGSVAESRLPTLVERIRRVHQLMVDAALTGDGFDRMAELAAEEIGRPVGIVLPSMRVAVMWPGGNGGELAGLRDLAAARAAGEPAPIPDGIELAVPITVGDELVGAVGMLGRDSGPQTDASEFLHLAATSAATAYALEEARERDAAETPGGVFARLRAGAEADELIGAIRAAGGTGYDAGIVVTVTEASSRPHEALALIEGETTTAVVELVGKRLYALLPAAGAGPAGARGTIEGLAARLRAYGPTGTSSRYRDLGEVGRALREAELVLDALADGSDAARMLEGDGGSGVYRLLYRALVSDPGEVKRFYEDTIAPLVTHDERYRGDLLPTLEAYLGHDCNMNATARAIYAHRHTVAYRLERVKELTGLDPAATEDRERLGLGLKALRIVESRT